jgi:hypothetical protein
VDVDGEQYVLTVEYYSAMKRKEVTWSRVGVNRAPSHSSHLVLSDGDKRPIGGDGLDVPSRPNDRDWEARTLSSASHGACAKRRSW